MEYYLIRFAAETAILHDSSGNSLGIQEVILLVVDILSILIGIVGVIGIVYMGIQYMTAGGNEEKTRKAKRRLFEIVIGLAAYAAGYALLKWLLPNFNPGSDATSALITLIGA